ncbi:hypothetical protein [Curtobacterium sp. MCBD17_040]|uniref:hypothetical protein n=1 Tax=Curtobacterium sp. MCBD17_040 TaxID=2175674 RepID=UPI0015E8E521|nr:hypothetical protein [Curtobacterium sp. MCBD17_040]WIB65283.1 hypothetical protein DEI94_17920 [Curtobacterium sp. MCBD17_040]
MSRIIIEIREGGRVTHIERDSRDSRYSTADPKRANLEQDLATAARDALLGARGPEHDA